MINFVTSDIHSYFDIFYKALIDAGFDKENPEHRLIICGDAFDRGSQSKETLEYIMSLERVVIVKGNHDILFDELCERGYAQSHDYHNGTVQTIKDLSGVYEDEWFKEACKLAQEELKDYKKKLVNYFETENYIFIHSWLPAIPKGIYSREYVYDKFWRDEPDYVWNDAMWVNPFKMANRGLNETGKTIVFGHWHCSSGWYMGKPFEISEFGKDAIWEPYKNEEHKIIGIDRCTAYTGECNVIIIEDNDI